MRVRREGAPGGAPLKRPRALDAARSMRATGTVLVGDISNTLTTAGRSARLALAASCFTSCSDSPSQHRRAGARRVAARRRVGHSAHGGGRRHGPDDEPAPIEFSVVAHAPVLGLAGAVRRDCAERSRRARWRSISASRPRRSSSCAPGAGRFATCSRRSASGPTRGASPPAIPVQYLAELGYLRPGMLVVHGVHLDRPGTRAAAPGRRRRRDLSAQQRVGRRRAAAPLAFLRRRCAGGHRHRQPGVDVDAQPVRRAGGDAADRARGRRRLAARERDARRRAGARLRARLRHDRAGEARGARRRRRAARDHRCGRIPGQRRAGVRSSAP